jgi:hypothetical protein
MWLDFIRDYPNTAFILDSKKMRNQSFKHCRNCSSCISTTWYLLICQIIIFATLQAHSAVTVNLLQLNHDFLTYSFNSKQKITISPTYAYRQCSFSVLFLMFTNRYIKSLWTHINMIAISLHKYHTQNYEST